jgi:hypothetical protein
MARAQADTFFAKISIDEMTENMGHSLRSYGGNGVMVSCEPTPFSL